MAYNLNPDFRITYNGNDVTSHVLAYHREQSLCDFAGILSIEFTLNCGILFDHYDEIKVKDISSSGFDAAFYVSEFTKTKDRYKVSCVDGSKRLMDFFIDRNYDLIELGDVDPTLNQYSTRQVLDFFANMAGISVDYNVTNGSGVIVNPNSVYGMTYAGDIILQMLQQSGWYGYFNENFDFLITDISKDSGDSVATIPGSRITNLNIVKNDKMMRNRVVIYGSIDGFGNQITYDETHLTGFEYDSNDIRTVVASNGYLYSQAEANTLGGRVMAALNKITYEVEVTFVPDYDLYSGFSISDVITLQSDFLDFTGIIVNLVVDFNIHGLTITCLLDRQCPRIFGYYNWITPPEIAGVYNLGHIYGHYQGDFTSPGFRIDSLPVTMMNRSIEFPSLNSVIARNIAFDPDSDGYTMLPFIPLIRGDYIYYVKNENWVTFKYVKQNWRTGSKQEIDVTEDAHYMYDYDTDFVTASITRFLISQDGLNEFFVGGDESGHPKIFRLNFLLNTVEKIYDLRASTSLLVNSYYTEPIVSDDGLQVYIVNLAEQLEYSPSEPLNSRRFERLSYYVFDLDTAVLSSEHKLYDTYDDGWTTPNGYNENTRVSIKDIGYLSVVQNHIYIIQGAQWSVVEGNSFGTTQTWNPGYRKTVIDMDTESAIVSDVLFIEDTSYTNIIYNQVPSGDLDAVYFEQRTKHGEDLVYNQLRMIEDGSSSFLRTHGAIGSRENLTGKSGTYRVNIDDEVINLENDVLYGHTLLDTTRYTRTTNIDDDGYIYIFDRNDGKIYKHHVATNSSSEFYDTGIDISSSFSDSVRLYLLPNKLVFYKGTYDEVNKYVILERIS
jgi:hypothetical protein